jgi:hypothetical protein
MPQAINELDVDFEAQVLVRFSLSLGCVLG